MWMGHISFIIAMNKYFIIIIWMSCMNDAEILYYIYWEVFKTNIFYFMSEWVPPCDFTSGHFTVTTLWLTNDFKMDKLAFVMTILS
jgi:hypothetical protein